MRRLEYQRKVRAVRFKGRDSAAAVLFLAQIVRERSRLEQERHSLLQRVGRINLRLDEIGSTETKIVPTIKVGSEPNDPPKAAVRSSVMERQPTLPTGFTEMTLQY
jgi:hypothetical protein